MTTEITPQLFTARDTLRAAVDAVKAAEAACTAAQQIADRGISDLNRATTALQPFESLDARLAACRVQALKAGEWQGYPSELRAEQLEKLHATEEVRHAKLASDQLDAELDNARDNLTIAERELDEAAASLFTEEVAGVVVQLEALNLQREYLRRILRGAAVPFAAPGVLERLQPDQRKSIAANGVRGAGLPAGTAEGWLQLHGLVLTALAQSHLPDSETADAIARAYWQRFAASILSDPDAKPEPLPDRASLLD